MASPWPVLPDVGSMIVPPGFSRPARSAASIIGRPIRSLTEPPGLSISSFARISGWRSTRPEVARDAGEPDERRVADEVEDRFRRTASRPRIGGHPARRGRRPPPRSRASPRRSAVPVEPARPEQQPGQPPPETARVRGRIDGPGWSSSTTGPRRAASASLRRRARSSSSREPSAGSGAVPSGAEQLARPMSAAGSATPSACRCRAPRCRPSRAARSARRSAAR